MRAIDADALLEIIEREEKYLREHGAYERADGILDAFMDIQYAPTIEPERKKGRWVPHIEKSREYNGTVLVSVTYDYWFCDTCDYRVENGQPTYKFCPDCGAEMQLSECSFVSHSADMRQEGGQNDY